jgi:hypothetical protein
MAFETDFYSLGMLTWRVFIDGLDTFRSLYEVDHVLRDPEELHPDELDSDSVRRKELTLISTAIQKMKMCEAVINMAINDVVTACSENPGSIDVLKVLFRACLKADPEARREALSRLDQALGLANT